MAERELTLEDLKNTKPGMFASGHTADMRLSSLLELKWVAVRGDVHDWSIYYGPSDWTYDRIMSEGDKIFTEAVIRELVPCTEEAYEMYRF